MEGKQVTLLERTRTDVIPLSNGPNRSKDFGDNDVRKKIMPELRRPNYSQMTTRLAQWLANLSNLHKIRQRFRAGSFKISANRRVHES